MKTETEKLIERKERLAPQISEIEDYSKIKLQGFIKKGADLNDELSGAFGAMKESDRENLIRFIYNDIRSCTNGLTVFIDGGARINDRFHRDVNYRDLLAKHVAYFSILTELLSDRIANLDNMLRDIDFDMLVTSGVTFDSGSLYDRLVIPHVLIIKDVNADVVIGSITSLQKDKNDGYSENVSNRERLTVFFDQLLGERMSAGKITIFTFLDSYNNVKNLGKKIGTRLWEFMSRLHNMPNGFEERALKSYRCCRICLTTNEIVKLDSTIKTDSHTVVIPGVLKRLKIDVSIFDLIEEMKTACDSLNVGYGDFLNRLAVSFKNCEAAKEYGKTACEQLIDLMRKSPKTVVLLLGEGKN